MDNKKVHVHDEEALIEKVLAGKAAELPPDQKDCPSCADIVKDIQKLKNGLSSIEDEEPPPLHLDEILKKKPKPLITPWIQDLPVDWYRNPFIMSFGFLMVVLVIYVLMVFVFK
jgi:hypothetical protein